MESYQILKQLFSLPHILLYLFVINSISYLAMWLDKRKAKKGKWRISEHALMMLVLLGGGMGGIIGMYQFRHKTKKPRFYIGFPVILILEMIGLVFLYVKLQML